MQPRTQYGPCNYTVDGAVDPATLMTQTHLPISRNVLRGRVRWLSVPGDIRGHTKCPSSPESLISYGRSVRRLRY